MCKARRRGFWLASLVVVLAMPIASCGKDHSRAVCAWSPAEREVAAAELGDWRGDLSEVARAAMNNRELELYNSFTEADVSALLDSDPCLLREVQLPGVFLRVTELSDAENVRSYLDNDSIAAWSKASQLLSSVDAETSSLPADAEASGQDLKGVGRVAGPEPEGDRP